MGSFLKIALGLMATVLVGILSIIFDVLPGSAATVESELEAQINAVLLGAGIPWATVEMDGQKAVIIGNAPTPEEADIAKAAILAAAGSGGVVLGGVTFVETARPPQPVELPLADPFLWIAERQPGALVLSGYAPSEAARIEVFDLASNIFADTEISGELELASGAPSEEGWLNAVSASLHALAQLQDGAIEANNNQFVLTGIAKSETRATTLRRMMGMLPDGFEGAAEIAATPPPADITSDDALSFPNTTADGAVAETALAEATQVFEFDISLEEAETDSCRNQLREKIAARSLEFSSGGAQINGSSRRHLEELAEIMTGCPQFSYEIVGHTDSSGSEAANIRLSQRRADTVSSLLQEFGVASARLSARGVGSAEPSASNDTVEGRQANRRIEVDLIFDPQ